MMHEAENLGQVRLNCNVNLPSPPSLFLLLYQHPHGSHITIQYTLKTGNRVFQTSGTRIKTVVIDGLINELPSNQDAH